MTTALGLFGVAALLVLAAFYGSIFGFDMGRKFETKFGKKESDFMLETAYQRGRKDADEWWLEADAGIDRARQKIWREEGQ